MEGPCLCACLQLLSFSSSKQTGEGNSDRARPSWDEGKGDLDRELKIVELEDEMVQPSASRENLKGADGSSSWRRGSQVPSCSLNPEVKGLSSTCFRVWLVCGRQDRKEAKEGGKVAGSRKGHWSVSCLHCRRLESSGISTDPFSNVAESTYAAVGPVIQSRTPMATGQGGMPRLSPGVIPDTSSWRCAQSASSANEGGPFSSSGH